MLSQPGSSPRSFFRLASLSLGAALFLECPPALGQAAASASPEELDAEGTALLNQRRLEEACPKLVESFRRKPGTGVELRLALCQELLGKIQSAHASYVDARRRAEAAGDERIAELAERRARALVPRLSHVTIRLDDSLRGVASLEVWQNGAPLERAKLERPIAVDPGTYLIEATAPNRMRFEKTLVVTEKPAHHTIVIALPTAGSEAASPRAGARAQTPAVWSTQKTFAVGSAGVGLAGVAVGTILGLGVGSKMDRARSVCSDGTSGCAYEASKLEDEARSAGLWSTFAFGVGAAGLVAGLALWFTAGASRDGAADVGLQVAPGVHVEPSLGPGAGGLRAFGAW